jgi:hypothetical protein
LCKTALSVILKFVKIILVMKYLGGKIFLILSFLLYSGFFICQKCEALALGDVVINEIAWMGTAASANNEWLELKNLSNANLDLSGWILNAADGSPKINLSGIIPVGGFFLLERTSDDSVPEVTADLIYAGALGNGGEILELKDGAGNLIDKIDAAAGWPAGDNTAKQTMERKSNGSWQTSSAPDGTPKAVNGGEAVNNNEETQAENYTGTSGAGNQGAVYGQVLINEFVSYPAEGVNEWVELYNPSGGKLSLNGWTVSDGSGAETVLSGGFSENNYYFFVAEKFKGALNNSGDEIILYSDTHNLIDKVSYGKFGDQPDNNAPAPGRGQAVALKIDGQKCLYGKDCYALTESPTKGKANIISAPVAEDNDEAASIVSAAPGKIVITEIFPNPVGPDFTGEFIELYNDSGAAIDLTGYKIEVDGGRSFIFGKFFNLTRQIPAGGYFALYRQDSNLVLDNSGGSVKLYAPDKSRAAQILQYDEAVEGLSYCDTAYLNLNKADNSTRKFLSNSLMLSRWVYSETPTPGAANQIKTPDHPPRASFSAPVKINTGETINFDASDSFDEDGDLLSYSWDFGGSFGFVSAVSSHVFAQPGNYEIKLAVSDGQETTEIKKTIKVGGVSLLGNEQKIAVNNSPIVLPQKSVSKKIAVGTQNLAFPSVKPAAKTAVLGVKITAAASTGLVGTSIKDKKLGAALKISGTVIILPGVFGSQYFYLIDNSPLGNNKGFPSSGGVDASGGRGGVQSYSSGGDGVGIAVKIYNYYKNFPILKIGDQVSVSGTIGGSAADKYLKTKSAADIKIISAGAAIEPEKISLAGFKEENLNKFVQAAGEIQERSATQILLADGTSTIKIYLKNSTGVSAAAFKAGQKITVTGLLSKISGALAIVPRGQFDLAVASSTAETQNIAFLQTATGSSAWTIPARENDPRPLTYILLIVGAIIIVLTGFLIKRFYLDKPESTGQESSEK